MPASLATINLNSTPAPELNLKEPRKTSAPADSSERSFKHVLTNARKSTKPDETKAKVEKPKSGKIAKAKAAKDPVVAVDQRKKADKSSSKGSDDTDAQDTGTGSSRGDASSDDNPPPTENGQNPNDDAAVADDNTAGTAGPAAEAEITSAAHDAAASAPAAAQKTATKPQTTKHDPNAGATIPAKIATTANNASTDDAKNSAASASVVQAQSAPRPMKPKTDSPANSSPASSNPSNQNNSNQNNPAAPVRDAVRDAMTTAANLPTMAVPSSQRESQNQTAGASAVAAGPSSDPDSPDSTAQAIDVTTSPAPPLAANAGSGDDAHAATAVSTIDQSAVATVSQSLAGESLASPSPASVTTRSSPARATANTPNPGARFVAENHPSIVQSVKTQLLPTGGTMRLRLDPPELGAMQVSVHVKDGVVTASFETSNDQATKMLSHSLGQLKQALESQGITVGKMHVQQSARNESAGDRPTDGESDSDQSRENTSSSQQDEQRRETLRRMWERLALGGDPLDLVA
jgi:flagellar hook-length control protein FliK